MLLRFPEHRALGLRPTGTWRFAAEAAAIPLTGGDAILGIDGASDLISRDAAQDGADPLFDEAGGPTERARAAMAFCDEFARDHAATQAFAAALVEHGLLAEKTAQVTLAGANGADASQMRVEGFRTVDETVFRALPSAPGRRRRPDRSSSR